MCGVGIIGREPVASHFARGARRLEYRGYSPAPPPGSRRAGAAWRAEGNCRRWKRLAKEPSLAISASGHGGHPRQADRSNAHQTPLTASRSP